MLYFLDNVEDGGETAFPVADNITFDVNVSVTLKKQNQRHTGSRLSSGVNTYRLNFLIFEEPSQTWFFSTFAQFCVGLILVTLFKKLRFLCS